MKSALSILIFLLSPFTDAASSAPSNFAPSNFTAVYSLVRNGVEIGQVTDSFRLSGNHYVLVSESRATGPLTILLRGSIRLESQGNIAGNTLAPSLYLRTRSDKPEKFDQAKFDWKTGQITLTHNGQVNQSTLAPGTQDSLSQLYTFLFLSALPAQLVLPVANGKDVDEYRYNQFPSAAINTPAGKFDVVEYRRQVLPDQKNISVWIGRSVPHLPVQIRVVEDGVRMEHKLIRIRQ